MEAPFPETDPYEQGLLEVSDGNHIHWEVSGNPSGKPAVALHGGPGSGSTPGRRRWFDPEVYRLVQFDQRGCGRSTPSAADPSTDLSTNTTSHLLDDIELLRRHLGIESWLVWGASWGVTLGLAYAEKHADRVSELVLVSVTMTRRSDVHWLYHETGRFFPEQWAHFRQGAGGADDLVAAYNRLLNAHPDAAVRAQAAKDWCDWEDTVVSLEPGWVPNPRYDSPSFRMAFARLCAHYFSHGAWLEEGQLLRDARHLEGTPGVMIHGRLDLGSPADVPWLLAQAWADAELHLVGTGHTGGDEMSERMVDSLNRFAKR